MQRLDAKILRLSLDLAPEDEVRTQAEHTARLRDDPTYLTRWDACEAGLQEARARGKKV